MFTKKIQIALVLCGSLLVGGVALAQGPSDKPFDKAEWKAKRQAKKQAMLQKYDTNRDGTLSDAERTAMYDGLMLERFKQLDTDGNGVLSLAEFKQGKHKMGKRHARFKHGGKRGLAK